MYLPSLGHAFLLDLNHMGLLHPSINLKDIIIDKSKIDREKAKVKVSSHQKHAQNYENLICIGVDCRVDKDTLQYKEVTEEKKVKKNLKARDQRAGHSK